MEEVLSENVELGIVVLSDIIISEGIPLLLDTRLNLLVLELSLAMEEFTHGVMLVLAGIMLRR